MTRRHVSKVTSAIQSIVVPFAKLGRLEISITPRGPVTLESAEQFAALGVHRLILAPPRTASASEVEAFVESDGEMLIGQV